MYITQTPHMNFSYAPWYENKTCNQELNLGNKCNDTSVCDCNIIEWEENYRYNGKSQLTEKKNPSGITEYVYDENGSLISEKEGERTTSYRYDLLNWQEKIWTSDGREQENLYDGEGLRAGRTGKWINGFPWCKGMNHRRRRRLRQEDVLWSWQLGQVKWTVPFREICADMGQKPKRGISNEYVCICTGNPAQRSCCAYLKTISQADFLPFVTSCVAIILGDCRLHWREMQCP